MDAWVEWLQPLLWWLGRESLQVSLLAGVIALMMFTVGRYMAPRWRYALWFVLVVRVLMPWLPASRFSLYRVLPGLDRDSGLGGAVLWLVGGWILGGLLLAGFVAWEHRRLWRGVRSERALTVQSALDLLEACRSRLGITTLVGINVTDCVQTPTLMGFIRPRLLLPKTMIRALSRRQLCHIFLHELAHLKRHDIGVNWLMTVGQIVHWFNPCVWLGFYWMRSEREMACDQIALQQLEAQPPQEYGQTLICMIEHLAHMRRLTALAGLAQDRYQLKRRLREIVGFRPAEIRRDLVPALMFLGLAAVAWTRVPPGKQSDASPAGVTASGETSYPEALSPLKETPSEVFSVTAVHEPNEMPQAYALDVNESQVFNETPVVARAEAMSVWEGDPNHSAQGLAEAMGDHTVAEVEAHSNQEGSSVAVRAEASSASGPAQVQGRATSKYHGNQGFMQGQMQGGGWFGSGGPLQMQMDMNGFAGAAVGNSAGSLAEMGMMTPGRCDQWVFQVESLLRQLSHHVQPGRAGSRLPAIAQGNVKRLSMLFQALVDALNEKASASTPSMDQNIVQRLRERRLVALGHSFREMWPEAQARSTVREQCRKLKRKSDTLLRNLGKASTMEIAQMHQQLQEEWEQFHTLLPREQQGRIRGRTSRSPAPNP